MIDVSGRNGITGQLSPVKGAVIAAAMAVTCYVGAIGNGWAMDDESIIERNPTVHSMSRAVDSFFEPYWPEASGVPAGQYRPLAILWYSFDWMVSSGGAWWFHTVNVLLHGLATALLVIVVARWLPPLGALITGAVFAVHPVHVEAVANVVGRAEVATAVLLLGALLCARRYRTTSGWRRSVWLTGVLIQVTLALFLKEHAVVFVALLAADHFFESTETPLESNVGIYVGVIAVTAGWLYLWSGIAQEFVSSSETPALRDANHFSRLSTMFPAYFEVTRLLVWPFDLSPDYNPQMIPRRGAWSFLALAGVIHVVSIGTLGWLLRFRAPAIAVAIVCSLILYSPTSNFLFSTGVLIAERNLYLSVWAPAVAVGWVACSLEQSQWTKWIIAGTGALVLAFVVRTVGRVPEWDSTEQILTGAFAEHPENYRGHLRIGSLLFTAGDSAGALAQALVGRTIFPDDPFATAATASLALGLGFEDLALREADWGARVGAAYPALVRTGVTTRIETGLLDSALGLARSGVVNHPVSPMMSETYQEVLVALAAPEWVSRFSRARDRWLWGELGAVTRHLEVGIDSMLNSPGPLRDCWDLTRTYPLINALLPGQVALVRDHALRQGGCQIDP